jgi:iron complex outermembrane recepter protein
MNANTMNRQGARPKERTLPQILRATVVCAGIAVVAAAPVLAADDKTVAELQAENARLKAELEQLRKEAAARKDSGEAKPAADAAGGGAATAQVKADAAAAQEEVSALGKLTVHARQPIEAVHDVPVSISVVSGEELNRELSVDLSSFTRRTGNVVFNQSNTRGASVSIRGLGRRAFTETQDPSVVVVQDGVSFGLTQLGNFDFYDVSSVEVARGPQGTLGGKAASAGTLTVVDRPPTFTPESNYQLAYGQRDTVIADAAYGGPIIDDLLAWRGSLHVDKARGYYVDSFNERGNYTLYNKDRVAGRTQFLLTPTENLSARLIIDFEPRAPQVQNGLTQFVDPPLRYADGSLVDPNGTTPKSILTGYTKANGTFVGPRAWFTGRGFTYSDYINSVQDSGAVNFNETQGQFVSTKGASAQVDWSFGKHTLTSITAYRSTTFDARNDEGTPFDISKNGGGGVFYRQYSEELRLSAKLNSLFDYQAGVITFLTRDQVESKTGWGSDAGAWYATAAQYDLLDTSANLNRGAGLALLRDSLADAFRITDQNIKTQSDAVFGNANWHFTKAFTLNTGVRVGHERRSLEDTAFWAKDGVGAALDPVATARGYPLGGFASYAPGNTAGQPAGTLQAGNTPAQLSLADFVANRYYGATITAIPGSAYNSLTAPQKAQVAAAKAIRAGQIGPLINGVTSHYHDPLRTAVISPSYKFTPNILGYVSFQYGEKSGSALNVNGVSANVKPEKTQAFELGAKSMLLNRTLDLNADVFLMNIKDYQQTVRAVDEFATQTNIANGQANPLVYTSVQGNVPKVRVKGVELDGAFTGIPDTVIRLSGAYNDARYVEYQNAPKPLELGYLTTVNFVDQSGKALPGAAKWTFNVGAEYSHPVFNTKLFHASFNTYITSRYNNDESLTDYAWVPAHSLTDASIGLGTQSRTFDVNFVVKNAFDNRSHEQAGASGLWSYEPYPYPRWWGVVLSGKL